MDDQEYKVGRGRPPKETQFKKGKSGNPKGRLKKERLTSSEAFEAEMTREIPIIENNRETKIPVYRLLLRTQIGAALKGNVKACGDLLKMWNFYEAKQAPAPTAQEVAVRFSTLVEMIAEGNASPHDLQQYAAMLLASQNAQSGE